eukprot:GEMP01009145.1.p1 GENE.GEMP01009145.1~~GEMP01009145.1.p1  ORF type:complete len:866 (+),score=209.28 GEMP01009145.1:156-2753(+)
MGLMLLLLLCASVRAYVDVDCTHASTDAMTYIPNLKRRVTFAEIRGFMVHDLELILATRSAPPTFGLFVIESSLKLALARNTTCVMGRLAACLVLRIANSERRHPRVLCEGILLKPGTMKDLFTTSWPIFALYSLFQQHEDFHTCEDQEDHPSINWRAFLTSVQNWTDHVPTRELLDCRHTKTESCIAKWDDFSKVESQQLQALTDFGAPVTNLGGLDIRVGTSTVRELTKRCWAGVLAAKLAYAIVLAGARLDIMSMVETFLVFVMREILARLDDVQRTPWRLFALCNRVSMQRLYNVDSRCVPSSWMPATCAHYRDAVRRVPTKHVVLTFLPAEDMVNFEGFFKNLYIIGVGPVLAIAENLKAYDACKKAIVHEPLSECVHANSDSAPKLLTKYFLIEVALREGKEVLWIDGPAVILLQNPVSACMSTPQSDLLIAEELFNSNPRNAIFYARHGSLQLVQLMAEWLRSVPYSHEERGWHFLVKRAQGKSDVEHMSFLPHLDDLTSISVGILESSFEFVSSEGYAGSIEHAQRTIAFVVMDNHIETSEESRKCRDVFYQARGRDPNSRLWYNLCAKYRFHAVNPKSAGGTKAPLRHFVHISYAQGCCEKEQRRSSQTALEFGCDESRSLNGTELSPEFVAKNEALLEFDRTRFMHHKTPSNTKGYYVWKPYILLKTLQDPTLPWNDTVIVYTDAGLTFINPIRGPITDALQHSDGVGFMTEMYEQDWSKRDAFVLLDADVPSIASTHQLMSGFVALRKTALAVQFATAWLAACETRRVITEEPSETALPEYPSFRNNNDDQTAFSITFKKFGFTALPKVAKVHLLDASRNLAKFRYTLHNAAVGKHVSADAWNDAADEEATTLS